MFTPYFFDGKQCYAIRMVYDDQEGSVKALVKADVPEEVDGPFARVLVKEPSSSHEMQDNHHPITRFGNAIEVLHEVIAASQPDLTPPSDTSIQLTVDVLAYVNDLYPEISPHRAREIADHIKQSWNYTDIYNELDSYVQGLVRQHPNGLHPEPTSTST